MRAERVIVKTVGTTAEDIELDCATAFLSNNGATTLYVKPKDDGVAVTASNGFAIPKGTMLNKPLAWRTMSVISSGASGDLRILVVEDWE